MSDKGTKKPAKKPKTAQKKAKPAPAPKARKGKPRSKK